MRSLAWSTIAMLSMLAVAACDHQVTLDNATATTSWNNELDVLFVIDNSNSGVALQSELAEAMTTFEAALEAFPNGLPSLHIGVVSTTVDIGTPGFADCPSPDPGDNGLLQDAPRIAGCTSPSNRYLYDIPNDDGTRARNFSGADVSAALDCILPLGNTGCGFIAPLEAMRRALDGSLPDNDNFLRPEAALAVIILAEQDDCSVANPALFSGNEGTFGCVPLAAYDCDQPISSTSPGTYTNCKPKLGGDLYDPSVYQQFLSSIKDPSRTAVAVIGGDASTTIATQAVNSPDEAIALSPSCTATIDGEPVTAQPGIRLAAFQSLYAYSAYVSACQSDYTAAITTIDETIGDMMAPCLQGNVSLIDTDPTNPGLQPACTVTIDDTNPVTPCAMMDATTPVQHPVQPCWWIEPGAAVCAATQTGLLLHLEPPYDVFSVTCAAPPP